MEWLWTWHTMDMDNKVLLRSGQETLMGSVFNKQGKLVRETDISKKKNKLGNFGKGLSCIST